MKILENEKIDEKVESKVNKCKQKFIFSLQNENLREKSRKIKEKIENKINKYKKLMKSSKNENLR